MSKTDSIEHRMTSLSQNLSLHLNSSTCSDRDGYQHQMHKQATGVDVLLENVGNPYDERTHLLEDDKKLTPRNKHITNNNNSYSLNNNALVVFEDVASVNIENYETLSNDIVTANETTMNASDLGISDVQSLRQNVSNPRQSITTIKTKQKPSKLGANKPVGLKRVSFGSSKGSMIETLVFETPTPLSEHVVLNFGLGSEVNCKGNLDDSDVEIQEESERSIVRVSFYQSSQPQQICPPDYCTNFKDHLDNTLKNTTCNIEDIMTTASAITSYDRQQSTDSGWDNPFRPGGDLSREADEIVKMISGGKPITPTEERVIGNGKSQNNSATGNGTMSTEDITKANLSQNQFTQNGSHRIPASTGTTVGPGKLAENKGVTTSGEVSKQVVPGPISASRVVIDEKKSKNKGCCVVQ